MREVKATNSGHNKSSAKWEEPSTHPKVITMLGTLPPIPALSSYCLEMASSLADLIAVEFISFKKIYPSFLYPGGGLKNDYTFPKINHPCIKIRRRLKWYNPLTWIRESFKTRGDLLHAQWWSLPLAPVYLAISIAYKIKKKPVIFTVHNVFPHEHSRLHHLVCRFLFKWVDFFIVHAVSNKDKLIRYFSISPERVSLIPHGPLDFHVPKNADRNVVRRSLGLLPEQKVVLLFGAIRPYKGIETAIRSFSRVSMVIPEARLLIAGKLWESWLPYDQLISDLGVGEYIISQLEYIPSNQIYRYFIASDLILLPYHDFDSQSGVGALAVSFRKPMIVTNVGGLPELQNDGLYVIPPKDPETLAERIIMCLKDPQKLEEMKKGTEAVASRISWPKIAAKTLEVYKKVLILKERNH